MVVVVDVLVVSSDVAIVLLGMRLVVRESRWGLPETPSSLDLLFCDSYLSNKLEARSQGHKCLVSCPNVK